MVDEKVTAGVERGERKMSCRCGERWREKEMRGGKILNFSQKKIQKKKILEILFLPDLKKGSSPSSLHL